MSITSDSVVLSVPVFSLLPTQRKTNLETVRVYGVTHEQRLRSLPG